MSAPELITSPQQSPRPKAQAMTWRKFLKPLASLQLTVTLFVFSLGLVFFATTAQKTQGFWTVVDRYIWSWFVMVDCPPLLEFFKIFWWVPKSTTLPSWVTFPFPGGKLIGGLMFLNLLAAHAVRFKLTWKRSGVWLAHAGIILLFVGEAITREFQIEQQMSITEGSSSDFAIDSRHYELAFIETVDNGASERVTVVPAKTLLRAIKQKRRITNPDLPVDVQPLKYYPNSKLMNLDNPDAGKYENPATVQSGTLAVAVPLAEVSGVDDKERDFPSAYVSLLKKGTDEVVGVYFVSPLLKDQTLSSEGHTYAVTLRNTEYPKPYSLTLTKFDYEQYTGTTMAKNYTSHLTLDDPERGVHRQVVVSMNNPLRYRGETFYQHQFNQTPETKQTVLQIVRNPGWFLPYVACSMVALGLLFHFLYYLIRYLLRTTAKPTDAAAEPDRQSGLIRYGIPLGIVAFGSLFLLSKAIPRPSPGPLDLKSIARLPVVDRGRVKPLDTVARTCLRKISGQEEYEAADGKTYPAIKWFLDASITPPGSKGPAWEAKVIRIDNDQVQAMLGLARRKGSRYSLDEISSKIDLLQSAVDKVSPRPDMAKRKVSEATENQVNRFFESGDRDVFGAQAMEVAQRVEVYTRICQQRVPLTLPPTGDLEWRSFGEVRDDADRFAIRSVLEELGIRPQDISKIDEEQSELIQTRVDERRMRALASDPYTIQYLEMMRAYRHEKPAAFDKAVDDFRTATADGTSASQRAAVGFEVFLNEFAPAYQVLYLYVLALVCGLTGWLFAGANPALADSLRRGTFWLLVFTFAVHIFALVARMYLMDRWFVFVTNLYSSAVYIGCGAVGMGLILERIFPIGLGNIVAATIGGVTGIIAHGLAASGEDTLEMMQAVLDTNFWLATHVSTVTFGYAATYFAALLGLAYVIIGVFSPSLGKPGSVRINGVIKVTGKDLGDSLGQAMYGVICFATLLSFVGTVLGGIWADQSWGRFWGWDPKENGAVLIVIWNALILHARWCGLIKNRGTAVLTLVGGMITTWSWFGTNQLGAGLHNYGFRTDIAEACTITWIVFFGFIGVSLIPQRHWLSFKQNPPRMG
jgi:ABC-type transport system involved in cytochrome c biogenesis permease subunit